MDHDAVPGLGLPLRWHQENQDESAWIRHRDNPFFASALDGSEEKRGEHVGLGNYQGPQPLTVAERRMLSLINDLTDRADWHRIVFDQQFVNEWKSSKLSEPHTTQRMLDWVSHRSKVYEAAKIAETSSSASAKCKTTQVISHKPTSCLH